MRASRSALHTGSTCGLACATRRAISAIAESLLELLRGRSDAAFGGGERAAGQRGHVLERFALDMAKRPSNPLIGGQPIENAVHARDESPLLGRSALIDDRVVDDRLVEP